MQNKLQTPLVARKESSDLNLNQPLQILTVTAASASPSTDNMSPRQQNSSTISTLDHHQYPHKTLLHYQLDINTHCIDNWQHLHRHYSEIKEKISQTDNRHSRHLHRLNKLDEVATTNGMLHYKHANSNCQTEDGCTS